MQSYILGRDHYQIELLAKLDQVAKTGALISETYPKIARSTSFPAWALAILLY